METSKGMCEGAEWQEIGVEIVKFELKLREIVVSQLKLMNSLKNGHRPKKSNLNVFSEIIGLIEHLSSLNYCVHKPKFAVASSGTSVGFSKFKRRCNNLATLNHMSNILQCYILSEKLLVVIWKIVSLIGIHKIQAIKLQMFIFAVLKYNNLNTVGNGNFSAGQLIDIFDMLKILASERSQIIGGCIKKTILSVKCDKVHPCDLTEITTLLSQEENNLAKLISVIKMTCKGSESESPFLPENVNISYTYWEYLHHFSRRDALTILNEKGNLEGNCRELCKLIDGKSWAAKTLKVVYFTLLCRDASVSWDQCFCEALASSSTKVTTLSLADGTRATKTCHFFTQSANTIVDCLVNVSHIEPTVEGFAVALGSELLPRLSSSLSNLLVWCETRLHESLSSWRIHTYLIIVHSDLQRLMGVLNVLSECEDYFKTVVSQKGIEIDKQTIAKLQSLAGVYAQELMKYANVHAKKVIEMYMPTGKFWRRTVGHVDSKDHLELNEYAKEVTAKVLGPVVESAVDMDVSVQISVVPMVMKELCEAFMNYILKHKIKFSLDGARMLQSDVAFLASFACDHPLLSEDAKQSVRSLLVVRRLRGAVFILLKQKQPATCSLLRTRKITPCNNSSDTEPVRNNEDDNSPDEDFVTNSEEWSALRVSASSSQNCIFSCFSK